MRASLVNAIRQLSAAYSAQKCELKRGPYFYTSTPGDRQLAADGLP